MLLIWVINYQELTFFRFSFMIAAYVELRYDITGIAKLVSQYCSSDFLFLLGYLSRRRNLKCLTY